MVAAPKIVVASLLATALRAYRGNFSLEVQPRCKAGACRAKIGGDPRNVGIAESMGKSRHHDAGGTFPRADTVEDDLNQIRRIRQTRRADDREIGAKWIVE
ncbi:hypothetical protein [Caballeronia temeraria]|uniref:hypothetical protein n=1 Tax=Caballeronia temeraria TaxID=1777137 RepID=UPI000772433A|nr:hypothetical protein [Caballeronia temeraria]